MDWVTVAIATGLKSVLSDVVRSVREVLFWNWKLIFPRSRQLTSSLLRCGDTNTTNWVSYSSPGTCKQHFWEF